MTELLLYSPLYDFTAEKVVKEISKVSKNEEILFRINSPGGNVSAGFAILSRISELKMKPKAVVDGDAKSMSAFMLPFFSHVTANDTSELMFHKAAYPSWYEPTASESESLKSLNKKFEEKLRIRVGARLGGEAFLAKVFEADVRNDVSISAYEAKNLGIIDEVKILEPSALFNSGNEIVSIVEKTQTVNNKKMDIKTIAELRAAYPVLVAELEVNAEKKGIDNERDRVQAWMVNVEIDAKAVSEGIDAGIELTRKASAEFDVKFREKNITAKMQEENAIASAGSATVSHTGQKTAEELQHEADLALIEEEYSK